MCTDKAGFWQCLKGQEDHHLFCDLCWGTVLINEGQRRQESFRDQLVVREELIVCGQYLFCPEARTCRAELQVLIFLP